MRRRNFLKGISVGALVPFWATGPIAEGTLWETATFDKGIVLNGSPLTCAYKKPNIVFEAGGEKIHVFTEKGTFNQTINFRYTCFPERGKLDNFSSEESLVCLDFVANDIVGDLHKFLNSHHSVKICFRKGSHLTIFPKFYWEEFSYDSGTYSLKGIMANET